MKSGHILLYSASCHIQKSMYADRDLGPSDDSRIVINYSLLLRNKIVNILFECIELKFRIKTFIVTLLQLYSKYTKYTYYYYIHTHMYLVHFVDNLHVYTTSIDDFMWEKICPGSMLCTTFIIFYLIC